MPIYCDHNATTPLRAEVLEAMLPFLRDEYGNASSVHALGSRARCAVEQARAEVAALIGARPAEIVFTSGGTESNNLAIVGCAASRGGVIVSTPIEHSSIRESIAALEREGRTVHWLRVGVAGRIDVADVERVLDAGGVVLVSIGSANNEIGTIQPIAAIGGVCRRHGAVLHVDAVQAAGKLPVDVDGVDLLSMSAHKIGGPKGVGALYVRGGLEIHPLLRGGGQERGRRAGTENVAGIVGMGVACRLAASELAAFARECAAARDALWAGLQSIVGVRRNSAAGGDCLPNTLHVSFERVRGEALVAALDLDAVAVSSGSACAAGAGEPSPVLLALGYGADEARDGVRFSLGRTNTVAEMERVIAITAAAVRRVRAARERKHSHG